MTGPALDRERRKSTQKMMRRMAREGGGVLGLAIVRPGAPQPRIEPALQAWLRLMDAGAFGARICLGCAKQKFGPDQPMPGAYFAASAPVPAPSAGAVIIGICTLCAALDDDAELLERATAVVRRQLFPSIRMIRTAHVHRDGGRA